jgi:endonuclease/exonuclease/phosphatase family metal-dependent hydrolase
MLFRHALYEDPSMSYYGCSAYICILAAELLMKKILLFLVLTLLCIHTHAQRLKVITYNIHHGANGAEVDRLADMAKFVIESKADLVGLQEVDSVCKRSGNVDQMKRLGELTGLHYAFVRHFAYDGGAYGQGILSRYPISDIRNERLTLFVKNGPAETRALISVLVTMPGNRKLKFASAHFALDAPSRMLQSEETIKYLQTNEMPVIFTGDLNAEPSTKEVVNLDQFFASTDPANLNTFPVDKPIKKIDYIFVSKSFLRKTTRFKVFNGNKDSDHLPAMATVKLARKKS